MPSFLGFIPCRSGSKRIPDKNLSVFYSKTLIQRAHDLAEASSMIDGIIISTDSEIYLDKIEKGKKYIDIGLRSEINSQDSITDDLVIQEVLIKLEQINYSYDYVVHIRPTYPAITVSYIDDAINHFLSSKQATSLKSVERLQLYKEKCLIESPDDSDRLIGLDGDIYNQKSFTPSQDCNNLFGQTGAVDIYSTTSIKKGSLWGNYCLKYEFGNVAADLDEYYDFPAAYGSLDQLNLKVNGELNSQIEICFDIDGVLFSRSKENDYSDIYPNHGAIKLLQSLHSNGYRIILHTARGSKTGKDWSDITEDQLRSFSIPYDELLFGKPGSDFYIDDRSITLSQLKSLTDMD
ncbi:MAG: hypothetical protein JJ848_003625 [Prochlorococcus marinus CUG1439]|uniref:cytidylyltransferase domain-containing protein n=1 Tax=Prochlorococcus sp. MIT 1314 TaxID=3096220 RepID=UPI001B148867|nr:hypothetical protein [Prochlorococcus sp. MIT 1314]MCR8539426.1 hypothetical protein [Prochlorococcus marinus CUG1439]